MKYHGIGGVNKTVCTAEQKIAYNLAWSYKDLLIPKYNTAVWGFEKNIIIRDSVKYLTEQFEKNHPNSKYDIDSIYCCLGAGLEEYYKNGGKILWSYEDIGSAFPALYLDEAGGSAT
jgi:hypothetical protein